MSFDNAGLPGFQFIQERLEYSARTHHSTMDFVDRVQREDLVQQATVVAVFAWYSANWPEKLPRKAVAAKAGHSKLMRTRMSSLVSAPPPSSPFHQRVGRGACVDERQKIETHKARLNRGPFFLARADTKCATKDTTGREGHFGPSEDIWTSRNWTD